MTNFIWIKSVGIGITWKCFSSIRVLGFWFIFQVFKFQDAFMKNAFHLIWILLDSNINQSLFKMGFLSFHLETKVSFHPDFQQKFILFILFFTLQDLENLGMWQATTLKINLVPRFGEARVTSRFKTTRVLPPLKSSQLDYILACLESWWNFSGQTSA